MDIVDTLNHLIPSDQLDSLGIGQNLECEARNEFGTGILLEDSLKNMLSDKDPMFGSASSQFNPLDNDFLIAGATGLDGLSGALPSPPAAPVKRSVGRPRKHPRVTPPAAAVAPETSTTPTAAPVNSKPRGRPRKKPTNRQLSSFLIEKGIRGSQLKKELCLGGRVDIQDLDSAGLWLNPVVVLRRLTVTVGGFRIELLPGPSYDNAGDGDAGQAVSLQDGPTPGGNEACAMDIKEDDAAARSPTAEKQIGPGGVEGDVPLGLGPYVNPNDVQATNGTPAPHSCSEGTKVDNGSVSAQQTPSAKGKDDVQPTQNLPNDTTGSTDKVDCKDKLKVFAKAMLKPKPRLPTVKNKSLVSRRPKSQIKGPNPPPSSPTKPPQREDVTHNAKSPKKGVVSLKRPAEISYPEHASKVLKVQTGKPANPKPKSPGPSSSAPVRKTPSCDGHADPHDVPKNALAHNPKPERTPPSLGSPGPSSRPLEDGGQEKPKGKKPDKLLQRQKSKTARAVSVEEPPLFVPDNAPAASKKESADEQPAESAWDGTNSCGLCKKHHGNMFMVGCGRCDDWFHGDCVGLDLAKVQEMEEEDQMYVCLKCCAEESVRAEPEAQSAAKRPAPPEAEAAPEAAGIAAPAKPRQGPPQALASGAVRPMKKESDRRQSTEGKEPAHKTGHPKHKGSSSAPKKPASVEEIRRSVRDSLKEILLQRLKESDLKMAVERASEVARKTERELFHLYKDTDSKYKSKYRSLMFNLRDSKNNVLFRRVLKGDISPANLSRMSPEELASKELAAWRQRENRHAIEMIEKDQREAERRPITKITHKGEIEIESEEPVKAAEAAESPSPTKILDLAADLLPLEQKAESSAKVDKDTTGQHKSHLFDLHCKICTGRMAPPVEEAPTKVVKVATTVARRPSAAAVEETTKGVATTTTAKEDDLQLTVLEESLRNTVSSGYEARSSYTYTSAKDEGVSFLSTLQCMWRGFVNMAAVAKLVTRAFPVSGVLDHLTEDLPDSVQVGGRINPQLVWDYFDKIRATGTKEVCLIRFSPETEEDEISYTLLYAYFSSRKRFGVVSNNLKQVRDMYIIPLGATEKVPHQLVPFDGPGLESNRPNLLLGLIIRQRPKRDFLPVDVNETAAIIPETKPLPVPATSTRLPEASEEEEEEEEAAAKKYLSSLIPTKKAKETEKPVGAPKAEEKAEEPVAEPVEDEASVEEGEQGSESNKPLRFLPGVLLGWGGELPPLPDFGTKPLLPPPPLEDPRTAKATVKSPTTVLRLDRFVIRKREPRPVTVEAAVPGAPPGAPDNNNKPAAQRAPYGTGLAAWPGAGVSLREKPPEVSTEAYLASLSSPPPNGKDADKKEDTAAANVPTEPGKESAEGTLSPPAKSQTESPKAPLSGILKKSSVYSSAVEDNGPQLPPTATLTPLPVPAPSSPQNQTGAQNQSSAGSPPAVSPLPQDGAPSGMAAAVGIGSGSPSEKTKDPRVPQVVTTATAAACPPGPRGDRPELQTDRSHGVPAAPAANSGPYDDVSGAPPGRLVSQGPDEHGGDGSGPRPEELQTPPSQQQNHSAPPLNSPPASHTPPSLQQDTPTEPAGRPSPSTTGIKDYKRPEDRYSDPWERPRHADERDRDHHHHRGHHSDKKGRHQDRHRERSRHRGHSEERRKERHRGDEHGGRHKERHRHRRDSDHENGRRSSRDSYS